VPHRRAADTRMCLWPLPSNRGDTVPGGPKIVPLLWSPTPPTMCIRLQGEPVTTKVSAVQAILEKRRIAVSDPSTMIEVFGSAHRTAANCRHYQVAETFVGELRLAMLGSDSGDGFQKTQESPTRVQSGSAQRTFRHCSLRGPRSRTEALRPRAR